MLSRERIVVIIGGARVRVRLDRTMQRAVYLYGAYEYQAASMFLSLVKPGMTVADIGANFGQYTLIAASVVGSAGRVLAFEPNPEPRTRLIENVVLNGWSHVEFVASALSDRTGQGTLHLPEGPLQDTDGWGSLDEVARERHAVEVDVQTLDAYCAGHPVNRVDIIKLDVEGSEAAVLRGSARILARDRPIVLFEVNGLIAAQGRVTCPTIDLLLTYGYRIHVITMTRGGSVRLRGLGPGEDPRPYQEPWHALNLVALAPI